MGRGASAKISYAITDEYLFVNIGSSALLENAILSQKNIKNSSSLWIGESASEMISRLPRGASEYNYSDMESIISLLFNVFAGLQSKMQGPDKNSLELCDPTKIPQNAVFPHVMIGGTYIKEHAIILESMMLNKEEIK
jgi:hypothetical protein